MDEWRDDLRALPPATPEGAVRILTGDFNATLDHAELRRVIDRGYEDAADEVGSGLRATWPAGRRFPPPVTIDHVIADERCGVRSVRVLPSPAATTGPCSPSSRYRAVKSDRADERADRKTRPTANGVRRDEPSG